MDIRGKRVALALGGGGARGCVHFGAIAELESRGADIVAIAGTSMGAIVGGMYAAGRCDPFRDWLQGLTHRDVIRMLDPSIHGSGLISAEKIMVRVRELIGETRIEDLPIPFTAIATELLTGKEVWLQEGSLERAIRASIAIPSVITPLLDGGLVLVDGGLVDLVPVMPLASVRADLIVAVSVIGPPRTVDTATDPHSANLRTFDIMELSIQIMQRLITRFQLASFPPDICIELPSDICGTMDFHRAAEVAELGRVQTALVLDSVNV